ncbi:MAG: 4Fe-4S dicluster domain-containing protein [Bradyrhizobiaceae bacterium]|nr:4Fe-4S dicluster domain-containing protein [Bradyrhizobiaceae bacterium]
MSDRSSNATPRTTWQSLDHLAGDQPVGGEFTQSTSLVNSAVSRRGFMTALTATMALTAAACRRPLQHLVPAVHSNQTAIPGMPVYYTSVYSQGNVAYGTLVKTREGRPIKVNGNDQHPSSAGKSTAQMQASVLSLYDPDRIRRPRVRKGGGNTSYDNALTSIANAMQEAQSSGKKVVVLTGDHCSPSFSALQARMTEAIPNLSFVSMPALIADNPAIANNAVLGIDAELVPQLDKATVVVAVDADPLGVDPLALFHMTRYSKKRAPSKSNATMSKLIVAEAQYSLTGANADERTRLAPTQLEPFMACIEAEICGGLAIGGDIAATADGATKALAQKTAAALKSAVGSAVVLAGKHLSPKAHAMALNISNSLGSVGAGLAIDPAFRLPNSGAKGAAVKALQADLEQGAVHALLFCDTNPEYFADRAFRKAMLSAPVRAAINYYEDETANICEISIPASHWLESWSDAASFDGTLSIQQPMIMPLNEGIGSTYDSLMAIAKKVAPGFLADAETYHDFVKANWSGFLASAGMTGVTAWNDALVKGAVSVPVSAAASTVNMASASTLATSTVKSGMALYLSPSLTVQDGTYSNNAWLLELPDPVTKVTWENVALVSPDTAVKLGLAASKDPKALRKASGVVVTIQTERGTIDAPAWVQPGMADDVVAISLGYGRTSVGHHGNGAGVNGYAVAAGLQPTGYVAVSNIAKSGTSVRIACAQDHHTLDDGNGERPVAKFLTLHELAGGEAVEKTHEHFPNTGHDGKYLKPLSIVPDYQYKGHRWGMVIDMSACTGCSSCIIACQSENNIATVGKEQVLIGREMHWIRLDRYYVGDVDSPDTVVEPMLCQHCENAPCENVCPVAATTHSPEGLNEMVYNRCVGTRYCLNNCPYKVRRFNFLDYNDVLKQPADLAFNPDITVRMRGVMEKCTFCVQRLHEAKWHARDQGRARINDGEAVTACQEACPAGAIFFGDTNDPKSVVSQMREHERGFKVLSELNVRPQVTYLAKVRNS